MKKHLIVATGLALLSTGAMASKARMNALGQGDTSFFIDDTRSVFLNPAKVNSMNNYVVTEWGTASNNDDSEAAPHAEGGFFRKGGSLAYGVYFGNQENSNNDNSDWDFDRNRTNSFLTESNAIDVFVGGDMGMKWGARLQYSGAKDETAGTQKREQKGYELGLGVVHGDIEAYANLELKDESTATAGAANDKWEADMGINVGGSYKMGDMTFFADYDKSGIETTLATVKNTLETTSMTIGAAKTHKVSKSANVWVSLAYNNTKEETKKGTAASTEAKTKALPLSIGFETEANSWLTLRASIAQNVIIGESENNNGKAVTTANSTNVSAGATLTYGKLMLDGLIGTTGASRTGSVGSENGVLATDNLMTRVSVQYWF